MDRRTFLAGTGAVLLAGPFAAGAQQPRKVLHIGVLQPGAPPEPRRRWCRANTFASGKRAAPIPRSAC